MKISKFQLIILGIFVLFIIGGVVAFATYRGSSSSNKLPAITIWGTFPKSTFDQYVGAINNTLDVRMDVTYSQKSSTSFLQDFVAALARGNGPDAVLVPADILLSLEDKLALIPYSVLPQRTFTNAFIDEAQIYLAPNGVVGMPFVIDPLVMYWNRDMFNAAGIALPPAYWDEFPGLVQKLTVKSPNGVITKSAVALGDFANVTNAREVLATLLIQHGNPITAGAADGSVASALDRSASATTIPALRFFTQFVDPSSQTYSWNRTWPESKTAFLSGRLATYFGMASELSDLSSKNPNLNFDVTAMPQDRTASLAATYGRLYGFSIAKASPNANAAYQVIAVLTSPANLATIASSLYLPSVSRTVVASGSTDPYISIFNRAALISRTWLDADPAQSAQVFGSLVQSITTGQQTETQAVSDASSQYDVVLRRATGQ